MTEIFSDTVLLEGFVIICDDTGELVSPDHTVSGDWNYQEQVLGEKRRLVLGSFENVKIFSDQSEADAIAAQKSAEDGDTYSVQKITRRKIELYTLE